MKANSSENNRWSQHVTETSNALDLEPGVFTWDDPHRIARSLKYSAETSKWRKADPFCSAMSIEFYMHRAGYNLSALHHKRLNAHKDELRFHFGKSLRRRDVHAEEEG